MKKLILVLAIIGFAFTLNAQTYTKALSDTTFIPDSVQWYFSGKYRVADLGFSKNIYDSTFVVKARLIMFYRFNDVVFQKHDFRAWEFNRADTLWRLNRFGEEVPTSAYPLELTYDVPTAVRLERIYDRISDGWRK